MTAAKPPVAYLLVQMVSNDVTHSLRDAPQKSAPPLLAWANALQ